MLGATHACANPLTAQYGTTHGVAIALMLPHVVRWNAEVVGDRYADLLRASGRSETNPGESLARRLEELARAGGLPARLRDAGVRREDLESLSVAAGKQWTGTFNPRAFSADAALALYGRAF
jgi:alcohol dehydrogenase